METLSVVLETVVAVYLIFTASHSFEDAADWLGRNLAPGVKGASINAVGSSISEFLTTFSLFFFVTNSGALQAGIAVTAGSAVYNSNVIPAACLLAIGFPLTFRLFIRAALPFLIQMKDSPNPTPIRSLAIDKRSLLRDGVALVFAEIILVLILSKSTLTWVDGAILIAVYIPYLLVLFWNDVRVHAQASAVQTDLGFGQSSLLIGALTLDFNRVFFGGKPYMEGCWPRATSVLFFSVLVMSFACHLLSESIIHSAELLNVQPAITALILGAAATSLPDTFLSVRDAMKGNIDDAISNAFGSNTFDICIALGLPLFLRGIFVGEINLGTDDTSIKIRIALLAITVVILAVMLIPKKVRSWHAYLLGAVYALWIGFVLVV